MTISVLGDSTGNAKGEWVDLWAKHLASFASVTVHLWDQNAENWSPNQTYYPGAAGRSIEIWNASQPGAKADYPSTRIKVMQPTKPDFVILSFGHNGAPTAIGPNMFATMNAVNTQWGGKVPTLAILQNAAGEPRTLQTNNNQAALKVWAAGNGVPLIDVRAAFDSVQDINTVLMADGTGVHPNAAGQQLWVDAVISALG
ncbi:SGNH/GDSL hydrolase family protein [Paenarthrobacter sp.]|uniref:SGNH/GDSL hydrolase family protein n=1 Tax=Paenarthrobacter sp. TaxID=1931993 RepID=UPI002811B9DC|nr:SGNH/GDSL hydrolase family protein [Paenarthrobacter sp.]